MSTCSGDIIQVTLAPMQATHNKPDDGDSEARYKLAVRAAHGIIWDWNLPERTVMWGESIRTVLGYPGSEDGIVVSDKSGWWREKIHSDDRERVIRDLERCVHSADASEWSSEYRFQRADGTYAFVLDKGCILRDKKGTAIRMVGSMLDITQVKEQEKAILKLNEELQARISELEKFEEVVVGRELKMIQMEKEMQAFKAQRKTT